MLDLVSGIIWLAIIAAFVTPWIRAFIQRQNVQQQGRRPGNPRGLSESGGYRPEPSPPATNQPVTRFPVAQERPAQEVPMQPEEMLRSRPETRIASSATSARTSTTARSVRRALANPESVQAAIVLTEVLSPPPGLREEGRPPTGARE